MIKQVLSILLFLSCTMLTAQSGPQMADSFREDGKIYVVITVLAIIFAAIVIYLVMLDRKVKKLEEKIKNQ